MADFGADVIKVGGPAGDENRGWPPHGPDGQSANFASANLAMSVVPRPLLRTAHSAMNSADRHCRFVGPSVPRSGDKLVQRSLRGWNTGGRIHRVRIGQAAIRLSRKFQMRFPCACRRWR
ncbi:MAG: CoA transferase [Rhodopila sp.]